MVSQDFNAIENVWGELVKRLETTMPASRESREEFIKMLKSAVSWLNKNRQEQLYKFSTNQKERANDCLAMQPPGGARFGESRLRLSANKKLYASLQ